MDKLILKFLDHNGYFNTPKDVQLQLRSHPDFLSLKSITDTLDYFDIENLAANVPKDSLADLPESFLALLEEENKTRVVLAVKKHNKVVLHDEDAPKKTMTYDSFKAVWTGTVIAVEANEQKQRKTANTANVILILVLLLLTAIQIYAFDLPVFLLTMFSLAGVYLSYVIVKEEVGFHSQAVAKVCGSVNKNGNCTEVINAPGAKLFNIIALSDVCVTFFTGFLLVYTLIGIDYFFMSVILLLSLPVVLFSLYQQAVALKQWCALCLGVIGVLALQAVIVFVQPLSFDFSLNYTLKALFLMAFTYAVWQRVKPVLVHYGKLQKEKEGFLRFKRNHNLFMTMLHKEPIRNTPNIKEENNIVFGAPNPLITIYAVTNPFCGFCTDAFKTYYRLFKLHPNKIKISFIFNVLVEQKENGATQVAARILEHYAASPENALEAMNVWFGNRDVETWQQQYGIPKDADNHIETVLKTHRTWCIENEISYTPATIIDGYLYPKEYATEDLLFFIDDMLLEKTKNMENTTKIISEI